MRDLVQLVFGVFGKLQYLADRVAIFTLKVMDQAQPVLHLVQPSRVELYPFQVRAQDLRQVGHALEDGLGGLSQRRLGCVKAGQGFDGLADSTQQVDGGWGFNRAFIQRDQRLLRRRGQVFGVCQPVALIAQGAFLARVQPGGFNLLDLVSQHVGAASGVTLSLVDLFKLTLYLHQALVRLAVGVERLGQLAPRSTRGIAVEQAQVLVDPQQ